MIVKTLIVSIVLSLNFKVLGQEFSIPNARNFNRITEVNVNSIIFKIDKILVANDSIYFSQDGLPYSYHLKKVESISFYKKQFLDGLGFGLIVISYPVFNGVNNRISNGVDVSKTNEITYKASSILGALALGWIFRNDKKIVTYYVNDHKRKVDYFNNEQQ